MDAVWSIDWKNPLNNDFAIPKDFRAKGELFVFVDECHRTQSGKMNKAMARILPNAVFVAGFIAYEAASAFDSALKTRYVDAHLKIMGLSW